MLACEPQLLYARREVFLPAKLESAFAAACLSLCCLCNVHLYAESSVASENVSEITIWGERRDAPGIGEQRADLQVPRAALADALAFSLPVHVRDFGGALQPSYLWPHGADPKQTSVWLDGLPLQSAMAPAFDLSLLSPAILAAAVLCQGNGEGGHRLDLATSQSNQDGWCVQNRFGSEATLEQFAQANIGLHGQRAQLVVERRVTAGDYLFWHNHNTVSNLFDDYLARRENNQAQQLTVLIETDMPLIGLQSVTLWQTWLERGLPGSTVFPSDSAFESHEVGLFGGVLNLYGQPLTLWYGRHRYAMNDSEGDLTGVPSVFENIDQRLGARAAQTEGWPFSWQLEHEVLQASAYGNPQRLTASLEFEPRYELGGAALAPLMGLGYDSTTGTEWRSGLGVTWPFFLGGQMALQAATHYRMPSFGELYFDEGLIQGNPLLKPEQGWQWQGNVRGAWSALPVLGSAKVEARCYQQYMHDLVQWANPGGFRFKSVNVGQAQLKGIEGTVEIVPWNAGRLTWQGAWASAMDVETGVALPGRPDTQQRLAFEQALAQTLCRGEYVFESGTVFASGSTAHLNNRSIFNVMTEMPLARQSQGYAQVSNIFDAPQQDMFGYPLPGRTFMTGIKTNL